MMLKAEAINYFREMYEHVLLNFSIDKIPLFFAEEYIQVTNGVPSNRDIFTKHIKTLKNIVKRISMSDFYDALFDEAKQVATLRYIVEVTKISGYKGRIEVIAIFHINDGKITRCNELTHPLDNEAHFSDIGTINSL